MFSIDLTKRKSCHTWCTWMASHLWLQATWFLDALVTLSTIDWRFIWVDSLMFFQLTWPTEVLLCTLDALVWQLMSLQAYWFLEALDTICALELLLLPVWIISTCLFKWPDRESVGSLCEFEWLFTCVFICVLKLPDSEKLLPGFAYINGFSSMWVPSCVINWPDQLKSCHTWCT